MENIIEVLKKAIGENNVIENELMSKHTTFRIGGKCRYFCYTSINRRYRKCN